MIGALLGTGLRLEIFNEHDHTHFPRWPELEVDRDAREVGDVTVRRPAFPACP